MLPSTNFFLEVQRRMKELQSNIAYMNEIDIESRAFKNKKDYIKAIPELVREELRAGSTEPAIKASTLKQVRDLILKDEKDYARR